MSAKHSQILLDASQRDYLLSLISSGTESARKLTRARILLKADIIEVLVVSSSTNLIPAKSSSGVSIS